MSVLDIFKKDKISGVIDSTSGLLTSAREMITGEAAKTKLLTAENELNKIRNEYDMQVRKFLIDYEGKASELPTWLLVLRSIIRPVLTILTFTPFIITFAYDWIEQNGFVGLRGLPTEYWYIFGIVMVFWFGERGATRFLEKANGHGK